jgi:predicted O-linked N-acetylglucosamine transferase (SPINDLY family)
MDHDSSRQRVKGQPMTPLEAYYEQALAEHRAGRIDAAEAMYRQVLAQDQAFARAWHMLGVVLHQRGDSAAAIELIERAIALEPQWSAFYSNLGNIYWSVGRLADAERMLRHCLMIAPDAVAAMLTLGQILAGENHCDQALRLFQKALAIDPRNTTGWAGLGYAYSELGQTEDAIAAYQQAAAISGDAAHRILAATQLPLVYKDAGDVLAWRQRLSNEVNSLVAAGVVQDLDAQAATPVFSLPHQGLVDLEIQRQIARLYRAPPLPPPTLSERTDGRIAVGFISSYFNQHTIGKLTRGLITRLSRERFHVTVFSIGQHDDAVAREIAASAERYVVLPRQLAAARRAILENAVDVLVYTDIGMDHTAYSLAFSRLARVQCVTWGHPETTGQGTIDYFVSSDMMEAPGAEAHYHERLVRLPGLTFYYYRSQQTLPPMSCEAFGLAPGKRLYACPQSIYKFHPDFDAALAGILRRDPAGLVVLIRWAYEQSDELLRQRFRRVMPDVADRIVFIRRLQQPEFMRFLETIDVMLDPFPYGGGNSSLEGFSCGVPVVTLPTGLLRGRITQALCRRLGLEDCIARDVNDYVEIAVRLGADERLRTSVRERILANQSRLFEDISAVTDWERFLEAVAGSAR